MGGSSSSCVMNMSTEIIQIVLRENAEKFTTQVIDPGKYKVIPTGSGGVSLHVFKKGVDIWKEKAQCVYSAVSGTSFIVDYGPDGSLQIWRSVYGKIEEKDGDPASTLATEEATAAQHDMSHCAIDKTDRERAEKERDQMTESLNKARTEIETLTNRLNSAECRIKEIEKERSLGF